jgi:hypothetical protein
LFERSEFRNFSKEVCFQGHFCTGLDLLVLLHQGKSTEPLYFPLNKEASIITALRQCNSMDNARVRPFVIETKGPKILGLSSNSLGELPTY